MCSAQPPTGIHQSSATGSTTASNKSAEKDRPPAAAPSTVQFKFVTDSTQERSLIRRHAMQGVWRQRRQQTQQQNSSRLAAGDKTRKLTPKQKEKEKEKENEKSKEKGGSGSGSSHHRASLARRNIVDNTAKQQTLSSGGGDMQVETLQIVTTRPNGMSMNISGSLDIVASPASSVSSGTYYACSPSPLGGSELDPFGSLPIRIHQEEQDLLHLWLGTRSLPKAKSNALEPSSHSETQSKFLIRALTDCDDAASFHGIIAFAASHLASMRGLKVSALAVKHQVQAVQFITAWLKDPQLMISDNAISAVLRQLNIEMWWGTEEAATMHRNALERMIEMRGGLAAFEDNPALVSSIYRVLLTSRPDWFTATRLPYSSTLNSELLVPNQGPKQLDIMKLQLQCDRLVGLFYNLREVAMTNPGGIRQISMGKYPFIHQAILLLHSYSRFSDDNSEPTTTHGVLEESCRAVSIFYISSIIGDTISSRPHQLTTLHGLDYLLQETENLWNKSLELLYLVIVQSMNQELRDLERVQFVLGLMELGNRLTWRLWRKLKEALLDVVCGVDGNDPVYYDSNLLVQEVWLATTPG